MTQLESMLVSPWKSICFHISNHQKYSCEAFHNQIITKISLKIFEFMSVIKHIYVIKRKNRIIDMKMDICGC
jgi:hypothetical protein